MSRPPRRRWLSVLAVIAILLALIVCAVAPRKDQCGQPVAKPTWCEPHPQPARDLPRR